MKVQNNNQQSFGNIYVYRANTTKSKLAISALKILAGAQEISRIAPAHPTVLEFPDKNAETLSVRFLKENKVTSSVFKGTPMNILRRIKGRFSNFIFNISRPDKYNG